MVKTPSTSPSSPLMRNLYNPLILPFYGVLTMAHISSGVFHKLGTFFRSPYNNDHGMLVFILVSPIHGHPHISFAHLCLCDTRRARSRPGQNSSESGAALCKTGAGRRSLAKHVLVINLIGPSASIRRTLGFYRQNYMVWAKYSLF